MKTEKLVKKNVSEFNRDVKEMGSYAYTTDRLSSNEANFRLTTSIRDIYDFSGKTVLDIGCGDGSYTLEFCELGVKKIVGIDPADKAINAAADKAEKYGLGHIASFQVDNIYELDTVLTSNSYDCIVVRGVVHHLPDPEKAFKELAKFKGDIIVLEPNGSNPVLKLIEKNSQYHIEHEERSFSFKELTTWSEMAGLINADYKYINVVPFFCPDLLVRVLKPFEPMVEALPLFRKYICGQVVYLFKSKK